MASADEPISDPENKITVDEMIELFGEAIPIEAVQFVWTAPDDWTVGQVRARLREIAKRGDHVLDARVEKARMAFGDALSSRVNMNIPLGEVPVQALREAMAKALAAADSEGAPDGQR